LLLQEEESNKDKGKQPDYSVHPSYNKSEDINYKKISSQDDFNLTNTGNLNSNKILYEDTYSSEKKGFFNNDKLNFNCLESKKRKFSEFNEEDLFDEGKIIKKAKISHNSSLIDDFADVSCEPLDIIDLDG
jgi:hypothetical protein